MLFEWFVCILIGLRTKLSFLQLRPFPGEKRVLSINIEGPRHPLVWITAAVRLYRFFAIRTSLEFKPRTAE